MLKFYADLIAQHHTRTALFSDVNDVDMIYKWRIHASPNLQFWNYSYHWHDIRKWQVSTINRQQTTLATVFQDNKSYVQEHFARSLNLGHRASLNSKWHSRETLTPFQTCSPRKCLSKFFSSIYKQDFCSVSGHFSRVMEVFVLQRCDSGAGAV